MDDKIQMNPKGIFFDLYGTLLIYGDMKAAWSDWLTAFFACLRFHGLSLPKKGFAEQCDGFFGKEEPHVRQDGLTVLERRIQALCRDLALSIGKDEIRRIADHIVRAWQEHIHLDPDSIPTLRALQQNRTLGLISNFDHPPHVRRLISRLGLEPFFDVVVISGDVGVKKPDPGIFSLAIEQTGLRPKEVVYVGDTEEDITGAHAAAIRPISIQRKLSKRNGNSFDFTVDDKDRHLGKETDAPPLVETIGGLTELTKVFRPIERK